MNCCTYGGRKRTLKNGQIVCLVFQRKKNIEAVNCKLTSSFKFETSRTFDIPRIDAGFVWPMPVVVANANAPRLGIALPYAPVVNGVPKPKANGGITLGAPRPFTTLFHRIKRKKCINFNFKHFLFKRNCLYYCC